MAKRITHKTTRPDIPHRSAIHPEANWEAEDVANFMDGKQSALPNGSVEDGIEGKHLGRKVIASLAALAMAGVVIVGLLRENERAEHIEHDFNTEQIDNNKAYMDRTGQSPPDAAIPDITLQGDLPQSPESGG